MTPTSRPEFQAEVAETLARGGPVVALESTLIAHGLPWPDNLQTARAAEDAVRAAGAVPATVAVLGGTLRVGLEPSALEHLARASGCLKAGRRDLPVAVARGLDAATTVSATLWIARAAGIRVMATGGLGGVHRDAARSFDISNDLDELARGESALVVCSGFKSILDIPASVEALETRGVLAAGYCTDEWPAFTTPSSGLPLEHSVETPEEAAALLQTHRSLEIPGAIVLAQPVPPADAIPRDRMEAVVGEALAEADACGLQGKPVTPFLLDHVRRATGGQSLSANRALIVANAALAGAVATAFSRLNAVR